VLEIVRKTDRAIVEGVNIIKKHTKPNTEHPNGGIVEKEAPIHISNLMLVDPKTGKATRIGRRLNENGKLVRYSKKSGEEIK
jgi:large subunit ribosomal protein L24